jgi:hypothetical protein
VPETLTNPVDAGSEVVGGVVGEVVVVGGVVIGGGLVEVAPGRHCQYHSFCSIQEDPAAQAVFPSGLQE